MTEIERQIAGIGQGQHLCLLYDDAAEQVAAVVPYISDGLRRGERCLYITDDRTAAEVGRGLRDGGVDVEAESARGALVLLDRRESYLRDGEFRPREMIALLADTVSDALSAGYSGVRMAGEMTWALGGEVGHERLTEYEALLNDFFPQSSATGLCQYDRGRFPPETIYDALCTHPVAVVGRHLCPNHFFEPPRLVLNRTGKRERVEWRIGQLLRARAVEESLEEANRVKSDFLAAMSHDLRTPLSAILGYAEVLREGAAGALTNPQHQHLGRIEGNANNLLGMIDELLAFAKMEAGHEDVEPERVTLSRLVYEAVAVLRVAAEQKGIELAVEVPERRVTVCTDKGKVCKILVNLISNAIKYTAAGTVTVAARVEHDGEDRAVLEVRDTGRGIAQDHLEKIFDPFWRVKGSAEQGTGLGLSVTRRLARLLGGDVTAVSDPGAGSVFTATIPVDYDAAVRG